MTTGAPLVFLDHPHMGGTTTVYRELRAGLALHDLELGWAAVAGPGIQVEECAGEGHLLPAASEQAADRGRALLDHLERVRPAAVIVNVLADMAATQAMACLDPTIPRLMIVHNITPGTYAAARSIRDHVHATVGVSPRIREDLVRSHGFAAERCFVVANAIDTAGFAATERQPADGVLRILSLGRIEDDSKGILWLAPILRRLGDVPVELTIAGKGPDLERLRAMTAELCLPVRYLGAVPADRVPAVMAAHDVLLMPSRFEGLGMTLIEAMAAGCVPVASRIRGVTDFVVGEGETGLLFPVGDCAAAAGALRRLASDRALLGRLSTAGRAAAVERFNRGMMAAAYADIIHAIRRDPPPLAAPLPRQPWPVDRNLRPGLRSHLPRPVKNALRLIRERVHA